MSDEEKLNSLQKRQGGASLGDSALLGAIRNQSDVIARQSQAIDRMCSAIADLVDVTHELLSSVVAASESEGPATGSMD